MTAERIKKTEKKSLEPHRHYEMPTPFERMEEMFDEFFRRPFSRTLWPTLPRMFEELVPSPSMDLYEEGDNIVVKADLPGMTKEDIEINLSEDSITLSGEKKKEEKVDRKDYHRFERSYGSFRRLIALPVEVQVNKAKASFKDGVLEVKIPKTEAAKKKGHKIKIE